MSLEILYEDNHLLVVVKPVGILSQEDSTGDMDMLRLLKHYIKDKYQKPGNVYLGLVHRLDRMTGGVMVFAKTSKCAARLNEQIKNNKFNKKYYALVEGKIPTIGTLKNYLFKVEEEVKSYVGNKNNGKLAVLDYTLINEKNNVSLVDVLLHTGRHHQIRVQFSNINHPIIGDKLYGSNYEDTLKLYAYSLSFDHPITSERLEFIKKPSGKLWDEFF